MLERLTSGISGLIHTLWAGLKGLVSSLLATFTSSVSSLWVRFTDWIQRVPQKRGKAAGLTRVFRALMPSENQSSKQRIQYIRLRLDHTMKDTLVYNRLTFYFSGGVLALMLGAAEFDEDKAYLVPTLILGLLLIAGMNLVYARFVMNQRDWYAALNQCYQILVGIRTEDSASVDPVRTLKNIEGKSGQSWGSHRLWALAHEMFGLASVLVAIYLVQTVRHEIIEYLAGIPIDIEQFVKEQWGLLTAILMV